MWDDQLTVEYYADGGPYVTAATPFTPLNLTYVRLPPIVPQGGHNAASRVWLSWGVCVVAMVALLLL